MNQPEHTFNPFGRIAVPLFADQSPQAALSLASSLGGEVDLLGVVCLADADELSVGTLPARRLRRSLQAVRSGLQRQGANRVTVSRSPWHELRRILAADPPDLLVLEWPSHFDCLGISLSEALQDPVCNVALVRGPGVITAGRVLVPVRGGPYAELALRLALALPQADLTALHVRLPGAPAAGEEAFAGLARILPSLPGIHYSSEISANPEATILARSREHDLVILGASARSPTEETGLGAVAARIFKTAAGSAIVVKNARPLPQEWAGAPGQRAGYEAISILVDQWFAENTYHASEFDDLERLVQLKRAQGLTISLALPALNEEETVGEVIASVQSALMREVPLLDEIVLVDSNSSDRTRQIAADLGVPVYIHQELLPQYGARTGKGEALWKSLLVTRGDIIVWIDTDIVNIHPRFVYGVLGPLLSDPRLQFVKGFYQRPLRSGEQVLAGGGGRVTELTARPLLNLFYPELSGVIQPLSGEYGGRRLALEKMPFFSGYGVETGLLIDAFEQYGLSAIAQVDLLERVHHNQSLEALSRMSFTILQAFMRKLERRTGFALLEEVNKTMKLIRFEDGTYSLSVQEVAEEERPPMAEVAEYLQRLVS